MKNRKIIIVIPILLIALFLSTSQMFAQGRRPQADPDTMAARLSKLMVDNLELTEEQANSVEEINLKYANQLAEVRDQNRDDREAMRASLDEIRVARNEEMETLLTEEQYVAYKELMKKQMKRRSSRDGESRRGGNR